MPNEIPFEPLGRPLLAHVDANLIALALLLEHLPLSQTQTQFASLLNAGPFIKRLQNGRIADRPMGLHQSQGLGGLRIGHGIEGRWFHPPVDQPADKEQKNHPIMNQLYSYVKDHRLQIPQ